MADEKYLIGESFSRDGSDYDPSAPMPTWNEIISVATQAVPALNQPFRIIFLGLGVGSDGTKYPVDIPNGNAGVTTRRALLMELYSGIAAGEIAGATARGDDESNTPKLAQHLMSMPTTPSHIYGVVIKG